MCLILATSADNVCQSCIGADVLAVAHLTGNGVHCICRNIYYLGISLRCTIHVIAARHYSVGEGVALTVVCLNNYALLG